jgi:hypothetical protein
MPTVAEGLQSQIRNIEQTYGRSIDGWVELIRASSLRRHGEIVAWLKGEHGLAHGAANRVALVALDSMQGPTDVDPEARLYAGPREALLPIHQAVMAVVATLGTDLEIAPKKSYLSLRRRKQFGMVQPATTHVDLGLVLPGHATTDRLESAATFNALFTHRVRVRSVGDVDPELVAWLREAYAAAG